MTRDQLQPYAYKGVVAAARAFHMHTTTMHRIARSIGFEFKTCTEREQYRREQIRKGLARNVRELARQRKSQREICEALGITRAVLRHIADDFKIDINSRSPY